jgi:acetylornithine deacetylase/succinyl-diaminopimelate desuccinylase-like protein
VSTVTLRDEVAGLLQQLIRLDTVNPPGNETIAAELLRTYLEANGVQCELYARVPERANLVARIPGRGEGPRLLLLSHTDTVLADPAEWQVDPWSGELRDDAVWGRGALDMKGQVAAGAVAIASLAREGFAPAGDLIFAATADEEVGDGFGLQWLCEAHPHAVETEYAVNEGAGDRIELGGRALYVCGVAEKMTAPFVVRVRGRSGHASMPGIADNALVKAAPLIERLGTLTLEPRLEPEVITLIEAVTGAPPASAEAARATLQSIDPLVAEMAEPLFALTLSPTQIQASRKRNVVPALCEVTVDCRLLPGQTPADAEAVIRAALGSDVEYELEWLHPHGGTRSALETPLWDVVAGFVEEIEPGAIAVPLIVPGFTDSHWLREAFGTVAYGFFPLRTMSPELAARLIHSADERVLVDDLELGLQFLRRAARSFADLSS